MSTYPPQFVRTSSPPEMALQDPTFQDPYLSAPSDPEEASFRSTGIRLTPMRGEEPTQNGMQDVSSSPPDLHVGDTLSSHALNPASLHTTNLNTLNASMPSNTFLSPREDARSSPSSRTSPDTEHIESFDMNMNSGHSNWHQSLVVPPNMHIPSIEGYDSIEGTISTAQLLSPDPSYNPSPSPDLTNTMLSVTSGDSRLSSPSFHQHRSEAARQHQTPTLVTSPISDNLSVNWGGGSNKAVSPIVKVEKWSRGDSPERESFPRRPSQSTMHLQVNDDQSDDGDDDEAFSDPNHQPIRSYDGSWLPDSTTGQAGVDPASRGDVYVLSPEEMKMQRELDEKNDVIRSWSASVSVANSETGDDIAVHRGRKDHKGNRRRAKSAGDPSLQQDYFNLKFRYDDPTIPGPGALIHESSGDESSEAESEVAGTGSESPPVSVNSLGPSRPDDVERRSSQLFHGPPWQDGYDLDTQTSAMQPQSSSAAIMEYSRRVRDMETLSRKATWGTRAADVNSIIGLGGGPSFENLSIADDHSKKQARRSSLRKFFPKKTASNLKRQLSEISTMQPGGDGTTKDDEKVAPQRKDSFPHYHGRKLSLGRPKSPNLSTGGAVIAIASQMAAIGGRDSMRAASPNKPSFNSWYSQKTRGRSVSDIPKPSSPGLVDLMTNHGGPPVANIAYSTNVTNNQPFQQNPNPGYNVADDDEDDDIADDTGLVMDFPVLDRLPVPTIEGFKAQITQLNPRLQPALVERFANEQVRRYKKLVESKRAHSLAVSNNRCTAGHFCFGSGGKPKMLMPRTNPQVSESAHTQFQIPGQNTLDDNSQALGENAVTPAQFPPGVPLPPVQRLPAEFECSVCFRVKKFQKPSDWTKHIHEDVQPFTCTFANCNDPKSFKRKADWVRHETERHRKLEWWSCTVSDCHHTCYRKDNFVQHLVREHKFPEPKVKKTKPKGTMDHPDAITPEMQEEVDRERGISMLWELVETCRHDTQTSPRDEPCRFCGNICSSWKKLTVHLAKHMEQIAMPILALVEERDLQSSGLAEFNPTGLNLNPQVTTSLSPYSNGIKNESEGDMNRVQGPYSNGHHHQLFTPTYPPPHPTTALSGNYISAEPESYNGNAFDQVPQYRGMGVDLPRSAGGNADESQFMPVQPNSVSYPPSSNAMSRPRTPNLGVQNAYHLTIPPTQSMIDPQGQFCMSPGAESNYSHPTSLSQALSYDSSMVADYTRPCGTDYM